MKKDPKFSQMYLLDEQNRTAILNAVEKRIAEFPKPLLQTSLVGEPAVSEDETQPATKTILFLEVLKSINGSPEETLRFIRQKTEEAHLVDVNFPSNQSGNYSTTFSPD